ncbi:hypothetical protein CEXT_573281 [Caerostris extrusa]|uniref:Uncharacterized protein n=1 Tax=Caerostris extrusa TaxID=172846 RepID=A0AAV4TM47_CAEEX|nr:hypothetical protein CEXT_573281 [Caerostris extrusa]
MRVDDKQEDIFRYLEEQADTIDECIENRCGQLRSVQRSVFEHTSIDPKNFTIYGCYASLPIITKLLIRLRISRSSSKILEKMFKDLERKANKYQHPTLLDRLDMDIKLKIKSFCDSVERDILDVYSYKLILQLNIDVFKYYNNIEQYTMIYNVNYYNTITLFMLERYVTQSFMFT